MNNYYFDANALKDFENDNYSQEQEYKDLLRIESEVKQELKEYNQNH